MNLSRRRIENLKVFRLFSHHTLSRLSINKIAKSKEIILLINEKLKLKYFSQRSLTSPHTTDFFKLF
jgi:hypothetical protein